MISGKNLLDEEKKCLKKMKGRKIIIENALRNTDAFELIDQNYETIKYVKSKKIINGKKYQFIF